MARSKSDKKRILQLEEKPLEKKGKLIAKKDFKIVHNDFSLEIKEGDSLDGCPEMYLPNLKAEGVI